LALEDLLTALAVALLVLLLYQLQMVELQEEATVQAEHFLQMLVDSQAVMAV
jgi:hypothetical protein